MCILVFTDKTFGTLYDICLSVVLSCRERTTWKEWVKAQIWGLGWGDLFNISLFIFLKFLYAIVTYFSTNSISKFEQLYIAINHIRKSWRQKEKETEREWETETEAEIWSKIKRAIKQIPFKFPYESGEENEFVILNKMWPCLSLGC